MMSIGSLPIQAAAYYFVEKLDSFDDKHTCTKTWDMLT